jgi:hypothetical protein
MKHNGRYMFYHRTNAVGAREIIDSGFSNASGYFLNNRIWTGVWLSSIPVDGELDADGDSLLMVKLDIDERELSRWEWVAEGRPYREWLVPAAIINRCAAVEMVDQVEMAHQFDVSTVAA